jgi:hypothetical protein
MTLADNGIDTADVREQPSLLTRMIAWSRHNVRVTIAATFLVICACFAAATMLQMRRDYNHALAQAGAFVSAQAQVQANEAEKELNRLAAAGAAYMSILDGFGAGYVIESAEGTRVLNIALANREGRFVRVMKGEADSATPLSPAVLRRLQNGPLIAPYSDAAIGSSPLTIAFAIGGDLGRIVVMPIDPLSLLPRRVLGESAFFTPDGVTLAMSDGWEAPPPSELLSTLPDGPVLRQIEQDGVRRIVAIAPVAGWPLRSVASIQASSALATWFGSVPLYLFVILGPGLVGAALAVLLVSEFERADRARSALVTLRILENMLENPPPELLAPQPKAPPPPAPTPKPDARGTAAKTEAKTAPVPAATPSATPAPAETKPAIVASSVPPPLSATPPVAVTPSAPRNASASTRPSIGATPSGGARVVKSEETDADFDPPDGSPPPKAVGMSRFR